MLEVYPNLVVGGAELCSLDPTQAILHACKDNCHRRAVGYDTKTNLPSSHPEYLVARRGQHLVLNIVDAPVPIFRRESFDAALDFLDEMVPQGQTFVHCNGGMSRAPSIALLWLAKRAKAIPAGSFAEAMVSFLLLYPEYMPGKGIEAFLMGAWEVWR